MLLDFPVDADDDPIVVSRGEYKSLLRDRIKLMRILEAYEELIDIEFLED